MNGQKSILTFFKPGATTPKRIPLNDNQNVMSKRLKTCLNDSYKDENFKKLDDSDEHKNEITNKSDELCIENNQTGSENLTGLISKPSLETSQLIESKRLQAKLKVFSKNFSILDPNIGISWVAALENEFTKPYFKKLNDFVEKERKAKTIFPPSDQVWTWTKLCTLDEVKVVIIGQDPYHNTGQAHGLCFSVPPGIPKPPSLLNMFKELAEDIKDFKDPGHGCLTGWAKQGVLLLNAVLTVEAHKANSHKDQGWEKLTTAVIKYLNDNSKGIVFLLWGSYAQKKADFVDPKKHHILKTVHPSPLSASRGFFGSRQFHKCNELLAKQGSKPINWDWLPRS